MPPVTILAQEMRFNGKKVFAKAVDMLRVPLVGMLERDVRLKVFSTISRANKLS